MVQAYSPTLQRGRRMAGSRPPWIHLAPNDKEGSRRKRKAAAPTWSPNTPVKTDLLKFFLF